MKTFGKAGFVYRQEVGCLRGPTQGTVAGVFRMVHTEWDNREIGRSSLTLTKSSFYFKLTTTNVFHSHIIRF